MLTDPSQLTALLRRWSTGDQAAFDQLVPLVYLRLRRIAHRRRRAEHDASLDTTGLVHEVYLRLADSPQVDARDRGHFYALASRVMRNILTDRARRRRAAKRGGDAVFVELDDLVRLDDADLDRIEALHEALERLESLDARQASIVEMRYFGGLSLEETAEALGISLSTVHRELRSARAWLGAILRDDPAA